MIAILDATLVSNWYPGFFFYIDGGSEGLRLLLVVQLILGPLLTLVLYKPGKPGLAFDMSVVLFLQVACLGAGLVIIHDQRPAFLVYYESHFYSLGRDAFAEQRINMPDQRAYGDSTPAIVVVKFPDDPIEDADLRRILFQGGVLPWAYPALYQPFGENAQDVIQNGEAEVVMRSRDPGMLLNEWIDFHGGEFNDYAFVPVLSRYRPAFLGIRKRDASIVGIVEIPPQPFISDYED